jgi:hypothetical protein
MQPIEGFKNQISLKQTHLQKQPVSPAFFWGNSLKYVIQNRDLENSLLKLHLRKIWGV